MRTAAALALCALAACAPLRSSPAPELGPPERGRITDRHLVTLTSQERLSTRVFWASLSLNPAIAASTALTVEPEFGEAKAYAYTVALTGGGAARLRTRVAAEVGACVIVRRIVGAGDFAVVIEQPQEACAP